RLCGSQTVVALLLQYLEAHSTFDEERCLSARRGYAPLHALRETEMIREVVVQLADILEGDRVPQAAPPTRAEHPAPEDLADRTVGHRVVHCCQPLRPDRPDHRAAGTLGAHAGRHARIRPRADEDAPVNQDPAGLREATAH